MPNTFGRSLWRSAVAAVTVGALACGRNSFDASEVDLTGQWQAHVAGLGIETLTVNLVHHGVDLSGTGSFTYITGAPGGTVTAVGLLIGDQVDITFNFTAPTEAYTQIVSGRVEAENEFSVVFAATQGPTQVTFTRS